MHLFGKTMWFLLNAAIRGIAAMFLAVVVYVILGFVWYLFMLAYGFLAGIGEAMTFQEIVLDWGYPIIFGIIFADLMLEYLGLRSFTSEFKKQLLQKSTVEGQDT